MKTWIAALVGHGVLFSFALTAGAAEEAPSVDTQLAALKAENERLRTLIPGQSHAMIDVAYHFTNLWFAASAQNWPLAQFYLNETRNRIAWAIRLAPVRKITGGELALQPIFETFDKAQIAELKQAITEKDVRKFKFSYKAAAAACTSCHSLAEKPYLHVVLPEAAAVQIIRFSP
jgi:hypothetical protein